MRVTRKPKSTGKKIPENNDFIGFRGRYLFTGRRVSITNREKSGIFIFFNNFDRNLRVAKNKGWWITCNLSSNEFVQVNFNVRKIFITTGFVFGSNLSIFATAGIANNFSNRIIALGGASSSVGGAPATTNSSEVIGLAVLLVRATFSEDK
jgi:hypothetical protein